MDPEPLDEKVSRREEVIAWWCQVEGREYMHEDFIHRHFAESLFFDHSTKNGLIIAQSKSDAQAWEDSKSRAAFEQRLRKGQGVEYMIVGEPQPVADKTLAAQGVKTGIYVIRKQDRQRVRDKSERSTAPGVVHEGDWELTTLATYFVVGEQIYQAPSVFDIVGNRLLSAASSLNKAVEIANDLPRYTPATGYHYLPQTVKRTANAGSVAGSPPGSREGSVAPGGDSQSMRSGSILPDSSLPAVATTTSFQETRLLRDSLRLAFQHGDEFTDENPLSGEPGSLKFATSTAAVKKRRADEEAAAAKARAEKESATTSRAASPKIEKVPSPPAVFTEAKTAIKGEKSGKVRNSEKIKRRKSRANGTATSPTTPASATSANAPNSAV
jgi:mediator of RNA polymerase II transcription subunit 6